MPQTSQLQTLQPSRPHAESPGAGRLPRVLQVHNYYQIGGGEDSVFEAEGHLLKRKGHKVLCYTADNDGVEGLSLPVLAQRTIWNKQAGAEIAAIVRREDVDVVHFHNTLPLISPAGYWGARRAGAAVVQTLHNYRLICPGALLYRDGRPCETCIGKSFATAAIRHRCYRGSRVASAAVATMNATHRALGTWRNAIDRYIAITEFAREKFIRGKLPADKLVVKPNFLNEDPGIGTGSGGFALFVGRLDVAKGIHTLLKAWSSDNAHGLPKLVIVGDGPLAPEVETACTNGRIEWLGWKDRTDVLGLMRKAGVLLFPSEWYEGGTPMTLIEAFASGLPIVASDLGTMRTMIETGVNGLLVPTGDASAFAETSASILSDAERYAAMRQAARKTFGDFYAADRNYEILMQIYSEAIHERHGHNAVA